MKKHLYFICPTDYLETVINKTFQGENYFYTSLGNSISFNQEMVGQIAGLLDRNNINEISFVLSEENRIVLDAIEKRDFLGTIGLDKFQNQIVTEKEKAELYWQASNRQILMLSSHLHNKINELRPGLESMFDRPIQINGKIYIKQQQTFSEIYPELIHNEYASLN